jgi:hypothetical protein
MGLVNPIGTIKADVPKVKEMEGEEVDENDNLPSEIIVEKEDVFYFRGY